MFGRAYVVMDRLPGVTLNELAYRRPEIIEDNRVTISYQLGMHAGFAFVFGAKDGYQTNYIFDSVSKILTRIDKESFLEVPDEPRNTLSDDDRYTQEIAACELSNLKYIPAFRDSETRPKIIYAFRQGFIDKYADIKYKKDDLIGLVMESRGTWLKLKPESDPGEYEGETRKLIEKVSEMIDLEPEAVFDRLMKAKIEVDAGRYRRR